MNTPSHFLMTAALEKALPRIPIVKTAFLWGAIVPDLPLWFLSTGGLIYYRWILGWEAAETFQMMFDNLFFQHPVWITAHNLLHAPLILLLGIAITWRSRRNIGSRSRWLFWFFVACALHTSVDILTHAGDGPLLAFPLDWQTRFNSPISYWDDRYYGKEFQRFEFSLNAFCLIYLLTPSIVRWMRRRGI
ncbi:MAG: hypothetical protein Kow00121_45610 [Elainellaceae cyanobacterium]